MMDIQNLKRCHLPEEIIEEILSRFPVKSLLRFRCVSRLWRCLIESERFIKSHLKLSTKNTSRGKVISVEDNLASNTSRAISNGSLHSFLNEPMYSVGEDVSQLFGERLFVVGCCNGLVCIFSKSLNQLYLWNPFTRITKVLPSIENIGFSIPIGFGWDESSGAYKVCAFTCAFRNDLIVSSIRRFVVYSSKTNSWKTVAEKCDRRYMRFNGQFLCGKVHWPRVKRRGNHGDIVSFDLKSETFRVMEMVSLTPTWGNLWLGVLGECLCFVCTAGNKTDVWVMKEYGVKESWFKFIDAVPDNRFGGALAKVPNGEILLTHATGFLVIDTLKEIHHFRHAHLCVQSLVSP